MKSPAGNGRMRTLCSGPGATATTASGAGAAGPWTHLFAVIGVATVGLLSFLCFQLSVLSPHIVRLSTLADNVMPAGNPQAMTSILKVVDRASHAIDYMDQLLLTGSMPRLANEVTILVTDDHSSVRLHNSSLAAVSQFVFIIRALTASGASESRAIGKWSLYCFP